MRPDFSLIWGADNAPFTPIEASDYTAGWVFRTGAPPRRVNFDYFQNLSDQRTAWLGEQMLLAVGHEWQDDVSYNAYAVVRSPVNGQLYRSLAGGNLGNEPSVSGSQWALGVAENSTDSIAGIQRNATQAETNAGVVDTASVTPLKLRFGFAASIGSTGYIKFPAWLGGLIIQWGGISFDNNFKSFTLTYPTAVFVTVGGASNYDVGAAIPNRVIAVSCTNQTTSGFTSRSGNSLSTSGYYISVGN